jgi:Multiubiquitin
MEPGGQQEKATAGGGAPTRTAVRVTITVNNKPVTVRGPRLTGLEIKQAAIDQGVPIGLDFVLSELRPNERPRIIGNDDPVTVNKNSRFTAVAADDDS